MSTSDKGFEDSKFVANNERDNSGTKLGNVDISTLSFQGNDVYTSVDGLDDWDEFAVNNGGKDMTLKEAKIDGSDDGLCVTQDINLIARAFLKNKVGDEESKKRYEQLVKTGRPYAYSDSVTTKTLFGPGSTGFDKTKTNEIQRSVLRLMKNLANKTLKGGGDPPEPDWGSEFYRQLATYARYDQVDYDRFFNNEQDIDDPNSPSSQFLTLAAKVYLFDKKGYPNRTIDELNTMFKARIEDIALYRPPDSGPSQSKAAIEYLDVKEQKALFELPKDKKGQPRELTATDFVLGPNSHQIKKYRAQKNRFGKFNRRRIDMIDVGTRMFQCRYKNPTGGGPVKLSDLCKSGKPDPNYNNVTAKNPGGLEDDNFTKAAMVKIAAYYAACVLTHCRLTGEPMTLAKKWQEAWRNKTLAPTKARALYNIIPDANGAHSAAPLAPLAVPQDEDLLASSGMSDVGI